MSLTTPKDMPKTIDMKFPIAVNMIIGGLAGCFAESLTIPLDTAKVRQQVDGEKAAKGAPRKYLGSYNTLRLVAKEEGIIAWYRGLSAGLLRQCVFATLRLGMYDPTKEFIERKFNLDQKSLGNNILAALFTGGFAISIASPTDRFKVIFQKNPGAFPNLRTAILTISKNDGVKGLWRGVEANIVRNSIINAAELATYDQMKKLILGSKIFDDNIYCHFFASLVTGFTASLVGNPVDVVKTRIMGDTKKLYHGTINCFTTTLKNEGPWAFYKGYLSHAYRAVSWNIAMFMMREQLRILAYPQWGKPAH